MLRTYIDVLDFFYWYLVFRGPPNGVSRCQICQDVVAEFFQSKWVSRFNHESQSELVLHSLGKNIYFRAGFGTMILKWEISYEMNCIVWISLVFSEKHIYICLSSSPICWREWPHLERHMRMVLIPLSIFPKALIRHSSGGCQDDFIS